MIVVGPDSPQEELDQVPAWVHVYARSLTVVYWNQRDAGVNTWVYNREYILTTDNDDATSDGSTHLRWRENGQERELALIGSLEDAHAIITAINLAKECLIQRHEERA